MVDAKQSPFARQAEASEAATFEIAANSQPEPPSQLFVYGKSLIMLLLGFGVMFTMLMPACFRTEGMTDTCHHPGLPGGAVFDLVEVLVVGYVGGSLVNCLGLPPLFGMLIAGYVLKNVIPDQLNGLSSTTNSTLRNVALAIIMLRAGMGLNIAKLRENSVKTLLLSTIPCICEASTIAGVAHFLFPVMTLPFCFMLGFVIADVSPAVTTPILLDFMSQGLGQNKGIPTILLAAGSVNSVVAIVMYSVVNEFAWDGDVSGAKLAQILGVKLVLQILGVGVIAGWIFGRLTELSWRLTPNAGERFLILFLVAMLMLFGFKRIDMGGGGTLAVLTCGATLQNTIADKEESKPVSDIMATVWSNCGAVMLFTLLGASVDQSKLESSKILLGTLTVFIGLIGRSIACFGTVSLIKEWNAKEKAFCMVAWCPKATVQAALATVSLDHVRMLIQKGDLPAETEQVTKDFLEEANVILTTAVLSIILTAPLFAVLMTYTGKKWLTKTNVLLDDEPERDWSVCGSVVGEGLRTSRTSND